MKIRTLSLSNFLCYYGRAASNTFRFSDGINLIIGHNGAGKSKIYDAFYWVLYDQIFDTGQRVFKPTGRVKSMTIGLSPTRTRDGSSRRNQPGAGSSLRATRTPRPSLIK